MDLSEQIVPARGYAHFGCPDCGYIRSLQWERGEALPWCVHANNYSWRPPHPETQAGPRPWTQMVPVTVRSEAV